MLRTSVTTQPAVCRLCIAFASATHGAECVATGVCELHIFTTAEARAVGPLHLEALLASGATATCPEGRNIGR